jgi:hypothetical protein
MQVTIEHLNEEFRSPERLAIQVPDTMDRAALLKLGQTLQSICEIHGRSLRQAAIESGLVVLPEPVAVIELDDDQRRVQVVRRNATGHYEYQDESLRYYDYGAHFGPGDKEG